MTTDLHGQDARSGSELRLIDLSPPREDVLGEALGGLLASPKTLPSKLLYDAKGSALFERITGLEEYYPTRTELSILKAHLPEIADLAGPSAWVVEPGSGSGTKTRALLGALERPSALTLIDISRAALVASARSLRSEFPSIELTGVVGDYTRALELPACEARYERKIGFFPGSTLGNFSRTDAAAFLRRLARVLGPSGALVLGLDRVKDRAVLERAYDDAEGVTARFNLNLLARLNDEGADFDLSAFRHEARYVAEARRVEMRLVSTKRQRARLGGRLVSFEEGESICTEHCHKFSRDDIETLARDAGFHVGRIFSDPREFFSVVWLEVGASGDPTMRLG